MMIPSGLGSLLVTFIVLPQCTFTSFTALQVFATFQMLSLFQDLHNLTPTLLCMNCHFVGLLRNHLQATCFVFLLWATDIPITSCFASITVMFTSLFIDFLTIEDLLKCLQKILLLRTRCSQWSFSSLFLEYFQSTYTMAPNGFKMVVYMGRNNPVFARWRVQLLHSWVSARRRFELHRKTSRHAFDERRLW